MSSKEIQRQSPEQQYKNASRLFRHYWTGMNESIQSARNEAIHMLVALKDAGYEQTEAINKIVEDHKDLPGLSQASIYRYLPKELKNESIGRPSKSDTSSTGLGHPNLSRDKLGQTNTNNTKQQQQTDPDTPEYVKELNKSDDEDDTDYFDDDAKAKPIKQWQFKTTLTIKDQDIPVIVTVYPDKRNGIVEVDTQEARRLNKRK